MSISLSLAIVSDLVDFRWKGSFCVLPEIGVAKIQALEGFPFHLLSTLVLEGSRFSI